MIRLKSVVLWLFDKNTCRFMKFTKKNKYSYKLNWSLWTFCRQVSWCTRQPNTGQKERSPRITRAFSCRYTQKAQGEWAHSSKQSHGSSNIEFPTNLKGRISWYTSVRSYSTDTRSKCCSWQHFRWWMCMFCMQRRVPNGVICGAPYHLF